MDKITLSNKIQLALNRELIRRLMIQYFSTKGFSESFDKRIHPASLVDLPSRIPRLSEKLEVTAFVKDIDPQTGTVKLGWNLFVLGTRRMYLGESTHTNLAEITSQMATSTESRGAQPSYATPKRIVEFVTKILGDSESGDITATRTRATARSVFPVSTGDTSGYFRKPTPVF
jgi:hypothetical protein